MNFFKETTKTLKNKNNSKVPIKISPLSKHFSRFIDENDNNGIEKYDTLENFEDYYFKSDNENTRHVQISVNGRGMGLFLPKVIKKLKPKSENFILDFSFFIIKLEKNKFIDTNYYTSNRMKLSVNNEYGGVNGIEVNNNKINHFFNNNNNKISKNVAEKKEEEWVYF